MTVPNKSQRAAAQAEYSKWYPGEVDKTTDESMFMAGVAWERKRIEPILDQKRIAWHKCYDRYENERERGEKLAEAMAGLDCLSADCENEPCNNKDCEFLKAGLALREYRGKK